jgi:cytochrome c5
MLIFAFVTSCGNGNGGNDGVYTANIENGKVTYEKVCIACHMKGVAGAAALDNKTRWDESAAKGLETLRGIVLNGNEGTYGVMSPRGTCTDCSDEDLFDALGYMLNKAGVEAK